MGTPNFGKLPNSYYILGVACLGFPVKSLFMHNSLNSREVYRQLYRGLVDGIWRGILRL